MSKRQKGIDKETLHIMYVDKCLRINDIARISGLTRQRVWQLLHEYGMHNKSRVYRQCQYCGKEFKVVRSRARNGADKYCQDKCYYNHRAAFGYNPKRQGQRIARKTIEKWLCDVLPAGCIVHHEDGDQSNNDLSNLFVFPDNVEHMKYHHAKRNGNGKLPYETIGDLPDMLRSWF